MRKELEEVLIKKASQIKEAGPKGDVGSMFAWSLLPYIGGAGNAIGGGAGSVDTPASEEEEKDWDKNPDYGLGVGAYRANRRLKRQLVNDKGRAPHYFSQGFGTGTSLLASILAGGLGGAAIGGGLGAAINREDPADGILAGSGAGAAIGAGTLGGLGLLATIGAGPLAAMTKRRTKAEQKAYANSPTAKEYLIPGLGQYNMWKSYGRAVGDSEERELKDKYDAFVASKKPADKKEKEDKDPEKKTASVNKKAETEYTDLPVRSSNALQGALADQLTKGPRTIQRLVTGGGLGLLAGLTHGVIRANRDRYYNNTADIGASVAGGAKLGLGIAGAYDALNRVVELSDDIKAYRAAERKQQGVSDGGEKKTAAAAFGAIPAIGNALSPAPAPAIIAKPQQQATTAQNQQQQAQNQSGEQAPQADTNTIADLTASLNKITDVAKNSIKPPEQNTVAQGGGETAQAEAVSGALKAASARYTKIASDRKRAIIYGIINKVMK